MSAKKRAPVSKQLRYNEAAGCLEVWAPAPYIGGGVVSGLIVLAFVGLFNWQCLFTENGAGLPTAIGMTGFTLLFFGFIPVVMLRRQRVTLDANGIESRFFLFGLPIWRNFIPHAELRGFDSVWDDGSDEGASMRLLIRTASGETRWGIDAESDEITELAKRLKQRFKCRSRD